MWQAKIRQWFPGSCDLCHLHKNSEGICEYCSECLPRIKHGCPRCGQPVATALAAPALCAVCQLKLPAYTKARAACRYAFPVNALLKRLKFSRQTCYAPLLADLMLPLLQQDFVDCDVLLPVPLHWRRHVFRGFNQATELAQWLSVESGLPVFQGVKRVFATKPQSGLSAKQRQQNLRDAFKVRTKLLTASRPLIIDDVMTTGTTVNQLAKTLLAAGADEVHVLTVARASNL